MGQKNGVASKAQRVFRQRPERIAAAWRRVRQAEGPPREGGLNLLDELVEPFVREVGDALAGTPGSPWSRTRGVLRLSMERGVRGLYDEFASLRRCLNDAVDALDGGPLERALINGAVDEAVDSAVAEYQRLENPAAPAPEVRFGGLVVELYERPQKRPTPERGNTADLH